MTTSILIDTSCLFALIDSDSAQHQATVAIMQNSDFARIIPAPILPEVCHLLAKRMGHDVLLRFVRNLAISKPAIAELAIEDYARVASIMEEYADLRLDFADAAIMTLAEKLQIRHILTLDRRDFHVVRPKHCPYFELLP